MFESIIEKLQEQNKNDNTIFANYANNISIASVVLLLIGETDTKNTEPEPCFILNKRSDKVPQPGDLCCPGGKISPRLDLLLSKFLYLYGMPLKRWELFTWWNKNRHADMNQLALFFSTGLREAFEEMRLNPMGVKFLGPMKHQNLGMLNKIIYPMVCQIQRQKKFYLNCEVDKIINIPLRTLLIPSNYALYKLQINFPEEDLKQHDDKKYIDKKYIDKKHIDKKHIIELPCFIHNEKNCSEMLWGATFRIIMDFLKIIFNFKPPDQNFLPVIHGSIGKNYIKKY